MEYQQGRRPARPRRPAAPDDGIARCNFCQGKIIWAFPVPSPNARALSGLDPKPMPLDHEPSELGMHTLFQEGPSRFHPNGCLRTGLLTGGQATGWRNAGKPTYQRHYKTCPKKEDWGKAGKAYSTRDVAR